jgi:hypothetical protein
VCDQILVWDFHVASQSHPINPEDIFVCQERDIDMVHTRTGDFDLKGEGIMNISKDCINMFIINGNPEDEPNEGCEVVW